MNRQQHTRLFALHFGLLLCSSAVLSTTAYAADGAPTAAVEESLDEVVVTGTLIRGIAPVGSPSISISRDSIEESGLSTTTELLRAVPQVLSIGADEGRTNTTADAANANTTGSTGINIRGLGTAATLVLVDGFRVAPGGVLGIFVDPSYVPTIALEGIEVVTDGASATYGSDAMAGVVNLRLRKKFRGVNVEARYGSGGDYRSKQISALFGHRWDSGGFTVALDHNEHSALFAVDRSDLYQSADLVSFSQSTTIAQPAGTVGVLPGVPNIVVGTTRYAVPANPNNVRLTATQLTANTRNIYSTWQGTSVIPQMKRDSVVFSADQTINDRVDLFAQGFYTKRKFDDSFGRGAPAVGINLAVPAANPNFITGIAGVTTSQTIEMSAINVLGPESFDGYERAWQGVLGAHIGLGSDWRGTLSYTKSQNYTDRFRRNNINACALRGAASQFSGTCQIPTGWVAGGAVAQPVAANAFNPYGANNSAVLDLIRAYVHQTGTYDLQLLTFQADGSLFDMAGGTARLGAGAEYSRHTESYLNDQNTDTAAASTARFAADGGTSMNVKTLFTELVMPFVSSANARAGFKELSVSVAGRYADYGPFGKTTNPKVGVTWKPIDNLAVNASYGTSYRVALISADPLAAATVSLATVFDCVRFTTVTCGAAGSSAGTNATMTLVGGNSTVKPEESTTYTLGLDFKPAWAPGLEAGVTYYNIDYKNLISTPGAQAVVASQILPAAQSLYGPYILRRPSYVTAGADDTAFNALVTTYLASPVLRIPAGGVPAVTAVNVIVDSRNSNSGGLKTNGLDLSLLYRQSTSIGDLAYGLSGNYTLKFDRALVTGGPTLDRLGAIDFSVKYRARGMVGWKRGAWNANAFVNYTPGYKNINVTGIPGIGSYVTTDLTLGYKFGKLNVSLDIQNAFDTDPPYALVAGGAQNFDSNFASPIGRLANLRLTARF